MTYAPHGYGARADSPEWIPSQFWEEHQISADMRSATKKMAEGWAAMASGIDGQKRWQKHSSAAFQSCEIARTMIQVKIPKLILMAYAERK